VTLRVASLCAGYDGLERGLSLAGVEHELVWWAEIDPAACTVMAAHTSTTETFVMSPYLAGWGLRVSLGAGL
jgi:site-specific DNA-cytosine methylase